MGASITPYDVSNTPIHSVLNYEGTPTQFSDDSGLKAILTRQGIMDVSSFNPIVQPGEKITADTPRQATNSDNQLLFLDANGDQTTRPTGTPMVGGTIGDAAYMTDPGGGGGAFGAIGSDLKSVAQDPMFKKFLLSAAAIGTGGLAAGALGAAAPVAEAFPVLGGSALPGTELGIAGLGGAAGTTGTLSDAEATALMQQGLLPADMQIPASGITASDALRYANLAKSGISTLTNATSSPTATNANSSLSTGLTGAGLTAALAALAAKSGGSSGSPSSTQPVNPLQFNWNYQAPNQTDKYIAQSQQILSPQYTTAPMAKGGVAMLDHNQNFASGGISDLGGYSDGGRMLKGPGDGMSDSIPATIENKRPARLATDEFVVPADVVSHLGNGSSEAGAKVLYAMMDKVRKARTGNQKQGKQINPSKFMPG